MTNNNEAQVDVQEKLPDYYEIIVYALGEEMTYPKVEAFKLEDRLLQFLYQSTTVIIPINENINSVEITPVYLEEKRIVQVP